MDPNIQREIIDSVITKCSKSRVSHTLKQWGLIPEDVVDGIVNAKGVTKAKVAKEISKLVEDNGVEIDLLGELELSHIQFHPMKLNWTVYKILDSPSEYLNLDPWRLRSRLDKKTQHRWKGAVMCNAKSYAGAVWIRLHLNPSPLQTKKKDQPKAKKYDPLNSVFVIFFRNSPYVIMCKRKIEYERIVLEAIRKALRASAVQRTLLTGRHALSLADIAHSRHGKGLGCRYRELEWRSNPLSAPAARLEDTDAVTQSDDVIDEDKEEKDMRRNNIEQVFGAGHSQPILEKMEYTFSEGDADGEAPAGQPQRRWRVAVRGGDVLAGLSRMARAGLLTACPP